LTERLGVVRQRQRSCGDGDSDGDGGHDGDSDGGGNGDVDGDGDGDDSDGDGDDSDGGDSDGGDSDGGDSDGGDDGGGGARRGGGGGKPRGVTVSRGSAAPSADSRCVERRVAEAPQGYMAGVNQPGVSYQFLTSLPTRWELVDAADAFQWNRPKQARAGTQLPQSAYSPLHTPYVLVGLGQTNDYVQDLMVGLPSGQVRGFSQAIIPNSRLVVIPFPYNATDKWELRLYLEARQQLYVGLTLLALLVLLGLVILILELRERAQDAREKKAQAPALPL
jgi:hypothetical protein